MDLGGHTKLLISFIGAYDGAYYLTIIGLHTLPKHVVF